jgi:hypothetical protein
MTWEGYWLPNLINATVFAALAAVVGLAARFFLGRWFTKFVKPWLEDVLGASTEAKEAAKGAEQQSRANGAKLGTALELRETNGRLVALIPEKDESLEYLKKRVDVLVAQLVIQASKHPEDFDSPTAPGRHTLPEADHAPPRNQGAPQ